MYCEATDKMVRKLMKEVIDTFPEKESIYNDECFFNTMLRETTYRFNENKYGINFVMFVFEEIVKKYVAEVIKPDTV